MAPSGTAEDCQAKEPVSLTLEVVSLRPRVFIIKDFLSDFEVEEIIRIAIPLQGSSQVGNRDGGGVRKSETRTSKNSWVKRSFLLTCLLIYLFKSYRTELFGYFFVAYIGMIVLGLCVFILLQLVGCYDIITTIAGTGTSSFSGDNEVAIASGLNNLVGVHVDAAGEQLQLSIEIII